MARYLLASSSQDISVASAASINLGSSDFTIGLWIRFPVTPLDDMVVVAKRTGGFNGDVGWEMKVHDGPKGKIRWEVETASDDARGEAEMLALVDGSWHFLCCGRDTDTEVTVWLDGVLQDTDAMATTGSVDTITPMVIGAAFDITNTNFITAEVAELCIYDRVLSADEQLSLGRGYSPRLLSPAPVFYMPLLGRASPEPDFAEGLVGTLEGGPTRVEHPRIVLPTRGISETGFKLINVDGDIDAQSSVSGTVTRGRSAASSVSATSSVSGTVTRGRTASVQVDGQSSVSGDAVALRSLTGTIPAQSTTAAEISRTRGLNGTIDGQATLAAIMSRDLVTAGSIPAQSALTALLSAEVSVSGSVAGQSALAATMTRQRAAAGSIAAASALSPTLTRGQGAQGTIAAVSTVVGSIDAFTPVSGTIVAQSTVTGSVSIDAMVAGTIAAQSTVVGSLFFAGESRTTSVGGTAKWLHSVGGRISK